MVGLPISEAPFDIILFSLRGISDYYMENNTMPTTHCRRCGCPSVVFRYLLRSLYTCRLGRGRARQVAPVARRRSTCALVLLQHRRCRRALDLAGQGAARNQRRGSAQSRPERRRGHRFGRRRSIRPPYRRARVGSASRSMLSTARICRPLSFPPSSIVARWSSPSAPAELPRFWRSACVNGSKRCFPRGSASLPN